MNHFHCVHSHLEMLLYALLLHCFVMAPKAVRFITASELQLKYGALLSQPPYSECTSFTYLHRALDARKPPIHITVSQLFLWSLFLSCVSYGLVGSSCVHHHLMTYYQILKSSQLTRYLYFDYVWCDIGLFLKSHRYDEHLAYHIILLRYFFSCMHIAMRVYASEYFSWHTWITYIAPWPLYYFNYY